MTIARHASWSAIAVVIAVVIAVAGCGGAQHPLGPDETGIGQIDFTGVDSVDPGDLRSGLGLQRARSLGQAFERFMVALDRARIQGYYVRHGFFRTEVTSATAKRGKLTDVTFTVTEGPRAKLTAVEIVGMPPDVPADDVRAKIPLADGAEFDYAAYELARPTLVTVLQDNGYAHARVEPTVVANRDTNTAMIHIAVDPGPRAVFGSVAVTGVKGPLAHSVKSRLHIAEGDPYSLHALADSRADVYDLGRFSLVQLETDPANRTAIVPVEVKVGEKPAHEVRLGGGAGYSPVSYEIRGRASYGVAGWPTPLMNSRIELRPAVVRLRDETSYQPRIEAIGSLERLDLFRPRLIGSIEGSFSYLTLEAYTSYGPRVHTALRSPLYKRIVSASIGWGIEQLQFRNLDAALDPMKITELGLDQSERVGTFDQALIVDARDNPLIPTNGAYGEFRVEEGTPAAGGAFSFVKLMPELRGYLTAAGITFAARAGFGVIRGDIPVTERFFAGGASSQRGFAERRLAPEAIGIVDGNERRVPYGGGAMVSTSLELRHHLFTLGKETDVAGAWFVDGADVTETMSDLSLGNLHWATGGGLRVKYVVPFRLDVGYRINRIGPMDPDPATSTWGRMAIHVGIGEAF